MTESALLTRCPMLDELELLLSDAMSQTFSTMLALSVEPAAPTAFASDAPLIAASVGFIGEITGVVYIYVTDAFARQITSRILGLAESEIDGHEMVNDTMGEMANMVVGQIKSRLCDRGRKCVLTIPSIVRGQNFSVEPVTSTKNRRLGFQVSGQQALAEILVRSGE